MVTIILTPAFVAATTLIITTTLLLLLVLLLHEHDAKYGNKHDFEDIDDTIW